MSSSGHGLLKSEQLMDFHTSIQLSMFIFIMLYRYSEQLFNNYKSSWNSKIDISIDNSQI